MKDQIITEKSDLGDKLTELWQNVSGDFRQLVFYERMARLEWVLEHDGECYVNTD
jgi:hypothetical protein